MQLADILMTLGDISAEGSLWQLAIEDYLVSLDIKRDVLEHNNRRLAEMYYKIAVAFEYLVLFEDAKTYYEKGVEVLIAKRAELVHLLSEMITNQTSSQDCQSMKVQNEKEIEEIDQLLPEVKSRVINNTIV